MFLTQLEIRRVRNLSSVKIFPISGLNLIYGLNASGKTSLLEAIHILSQGRSFRTPKISNLIQHNKGNLQVVGHIKKTPESSIEILGIERSAEQSIIRINKNQVQKTSELAAYLPVQVITPEAHQLLEQGPSQRRKFIDWGLFHVEHNFLDVWQQYHRILKQRNAAIRNKSPVKEIQLWDGPLIENGEKLTQFRNQYVDELRLMILESVNALLGLDINVDYFTGWSDKYSGIEQSLIENMYSDLKHGFTRSGPHRADLKITSNNTPVKEVFSRGQQKLLVCALRLAQIEHLKLKTGNNCVVMVDDLAAELDKTKRKILLDKLQRINAQTFVTVTEASLIDTSAWDKKKLFHVEHGNVYEVV